MAHGSLSLGAAALVGGLLFGTAAFAQGAAPECGTIQKTLAERKAQLADLVAAADDEPPGGGDGVPPPADDDLQPGGIRGVLGTHAGGPSGCRGSRRAGVVSTAGSGRSG